MTAIDESSAHYLNPHAPVRDRVEDLLRRLTLGEKVGQLVQFFYLPGVSGTADPLFGEPQTEVVEAAIRQGAAGSVLFVRDAATSNHLQRIAITSSRLGIPLLLGFDVIHGLRTIFPVPVAMAATWNPGLVEIAQECAAREGRSVGIHWTFAPMLDIARDARWGRIVEGAGEDPCLTAAMAAAQVRGFQGDLGPSNLLATAKHLVGYGAARGGRDYDDAEVSDSELWNVYLPPFRAAVEAGAATVMSAYMDLNGVPASGNRWLLTDVLRDELGFKGVVVSDNGAVRNMEVQHFAVDQRDAAARALEAGIDMEMCERDPAFTTLQAAVQEDRVSLAAIDRAVRRVLELKFRIGLFESPYTDEGEELTPRAEDMQLTRDVAAQSIVLLRNNGALPIDAAGVRHIAVVGQLAESKRDTLGPWVFGHVTADTVSVLDGLRAAVGDRVRVTYRPGASIPARIHPSPFDAMDPSVVQTPPRYDDDAAINAAVAAAGQADLVVVVVGERQNHVGEMASTDDLGLPGRQLEQLRRIAATGTPVVLLVMSARPLDLRWADANIDAVVQVWYPGSRGGDAVADVLFGVVSPAGRLPFTWPRHVGQVPMVYSHHRTFHPELQEERYIGEKSAPLYPFGHGLSYASFDYADLVVRPERIAVGEKAEVRVAVTNVSDRAADEVVQLYIHQRWGSASRPGRELKGFERISLAPGERRIVRFSLGPDELRYWSAAVRGFVLEPSSLDIWLGGSSTATAHASLCVDRSVTS
jgi:beta-glucosidase